MHLYKDEVKVTMTGLQEAYDFVEEINKKTVELQDLISKFQRHCLAVGIEIVREDVGSVSDPEKFVPCDSENKETPNQGKCSC